MNQLFLNFQDLDEWIRVIIQVDGNELLDLNVMR